MVALSTGWTPDVLRDLPARFRAGCHWALYAATIAGPDGLPSGDVPISAPPDVKLAAIQQRKAVEALRAFLYPEDEDG